MPELSCIPWSMVEVKVRVISKGLSDIPEPLFPQTMVIAVASPKALPIPRIIPENIPDFAPIKTTLKLVCVGEAPRANEPKIRLLLTEEIDVIAIVVMVGNIIIERTKTVARRDIPPAVWIPKIDPSPSTILVRTPSPNKP